MSGDEKVLVPRPLLEDAIRAIDDALVLYRNSGPDIFGTEPAKYPPAAITVEALRLRLAHHDAEGGAQP